MNRRFFAIGLALTVTALTLFLPTRGYALSFFVDRASWEAAVPGQVQAVDIAGQLAEFALLPRGQPLLLPFDETLVFDISLQRRQVPTSWATWSAGKRPAVLFTQGADSLTEGSLSFDKHLVAA